jgi:uncharacterized protein YdhG (YjbR/CyaY superfamily)
MAETKPEPTTVDEYIAAAPEHAREALKALRQAVRAAAPQSVERISYKMPTYDHHGTLVHFSAWAQHCGLYAVSQDVIDQYEAELAPYRTPTTTLHFRYDQPVPAELIEKLVKARVAENEARAKAKR